MKRREQEKKGGKNEENISEREEKKGRSNKEGRERR